MLSSHLCLGPPRGLFSSGFPTKPSYAPLLSPIRVTCPTHLILLNLITRIIFGEESRSLSSWLCNFLHSRYLILRRPKFSSQNPILKHPQSTFLPQCERPCFTPIQNNRKNYSCVYLNHQYFHEKKKACLSFRLITGGSLYCIQQLVTESYFFLHGQKVKDWNDARDWSTHSRVTVSSPSSDSQLWKNK